MRNPKDAVVSYLHHCRIMKMQDFTGTQDEFVELFMNGDLMFGHYDNHLKEAFERKNHPNLHIVRFEDLKANPMAEYTKLDKFLDTKRTKEQIEKICEYTSFSEMKKRDNVVGSGEGEQNKMFNMEAVRREGGFFRKGEAGNWKEKLSPENSAKLDVWSREKLGDLAKEIRPEQLPCGWRPSEPLLSSAPRTGTLRWRIRRLKRPMSWRSASRTGVVRL